MAEHPDKPWMWPDTTVDTRFSGDILDVVLDLIAWEWCLECCAVVEELHDPCDPA